MGGGAPAVLRLREDGRAWQRGSSGARGGGKEECGPMEMGKGSERDEGEGEGGDERGKETGIGQRLASGGAWETRERERAMREESWRARVRM